jgi:hypothetical protein
MLKSIGKIWRIYRKAYWMRVPLVDKFFISGRLRWITWIGLLLLFFSIVLDLKFFFKFDVMIFVIATTLCFCGIQEWCTPRKFRQQYEDHGIKFHPFQLRLQILQYALWLKMVRESSEISSDDLDKCHDWFFRNAKIDNVESNLKHSIIIPFIAFLFGLFFDAIKNSNLWMYGVEGKFNFILLAFFIFLMANVALDFFNMPHRNVVNLRTFLEWERVDRHTIEHTME